MPTILHLALCVLLVAGATPAASQDSPAARANASELSRAWAAIGAGDYAKAEELAGALLRRDPSAHAAITVAVAAMAGADKPTAALDAYEQWLQKSRHEDVFLLQPIAASTLASLAAGADVGLAVEALSKLAASDADAARAALGKRADAGPEFDGVRAALGDKSAITRLANALSAPSSREKLLALRHAAGVADLPSTAVVPLLSDPAPPVRAAAIETLARMQGLTGADTIRPLLDHPDPFVQANAAVALGKLQDPAGVERLTRMLESPAADTAAMAAAVLKARGVDVSAAAERILADPNPLTRLSAVPLLSDASRAQAVLGQAAADPNPVIRARAGELLAATVSDLATLRRLLRDGSGEVRMGAAASLLHFAAPRR